MTPHPGEARRASVRQIAPFALLFLLFIGLGLASEGTLTDDDVGRFLAAQCLFDFPEKLVQLWPRPAAMILFALPAQLGYFGIEVLTALLSTLTCFFAFRSAQHLEEPRPLFAAILTGLQPFFLLLSFSALTEPIAALFLAIALERMLAGRDRSSAIWASLIPLARLEMSLLLVLWAIELIRKRSWTALAWLPFGLILWSTAAFVLKGDFFYLVNSTFVERVRTVSALSPWQYTQGSIFVLGPVVFFFFVLGCISVVTRRQNRLAPVPRRCWLIPASILLMLTYYSLSGSQTGSLQSAGYLRHAVTVSPLFGLLALRGLNTWFGERPQMLPVIGMLVLPVVCWLFLSGELRNRYRVDVGAEYWKFGFVLGLSLLGLLLAWKARVNISSRRGTFIELILIASMLTYFFAKEGPITPTDEHVLVREVSAWCHSKGFSDRKVLCNHNGFHFLFGSNPSYTERYPSLNEEHLEEAEVSSIVIWDGHYGHKLAGGMDLADIAGHRDLRIHRKFLGPKRKNFAVVFEKVVDESVADQPGQTDATRLIYEHKNFGIRWEVPQDASSAGWQYRVMSSGLDLVEGLSSSGLAFELRMERFPDTRMDTRTFGQLLEQALNKSQSFRIDSRWFDQGTGWTWILGGDATESVLFGVHVMEGRGSGLRLLSRGPKGTDGALRALMPQLIQGLQVEK